MDFIPPAKPIIGDEERAAVIAVLTQMRAEETEQVRRVERREDFPIHA